MTMNSKYQILVDLKDCDAKITEIEGIIPIISGLILMLLKKRYSTLMILSEN